MQRETIRIEREMKERVEKEKVALNELFRVEREDYEVKSKALLAETAEILAEKDNLSKMVDSLNKELEIKRRDQEIIKKTIDDRRETLKVLKGRLRAKEKARKDERQTQEESLKASIKRTERDCEIMRNEIERDRRNNSEALLKLKNEHDDELRRMDATVKAKIIQKDEEIEVLKEKVLIEDAKRTKLEKLIAQYYKTSKGTIRK